MKKSTRRALGWGTVILCLGAGLLGKEAIDGNLSFGKGKKDKYVEIPKQGDELDEFYEQQKEA